MAEKAKDRLQSLARGIVRCVKCPLHKGRTRAVPGEGDPTARIMCVGEAPGAQEDQSGKPFCGKSGNFLDEVLSLTDLSRESVFITSAVKCRPPNNRTPHKDEIDTCRKSWLFKQIAIIDPAIIVLLGKTAMQALLRKDGNLDGLHGTTISDEGHQFLITYHPAAGMRFPKVRQSMRNDFRKLALLIS